jgi:hypothetical protein
MLVRAEILSSAVEDFCGMWEVLWALRSRYPDATEIELKDVAINEMLELLRSDLIRLYSGDLFEGEEKALKTEEASSEILLAENWIPPQQGKPHVRFAATEHGESLYYS